MWKLKKIKTREQKKFRSALVVIARQVVSFAESASAGIKFEKLFSHHAALRKNRTREYEFSFQNSSFPHLLRLVERRAAARGSRSRTWTRKHVKDMQQVRVRWAPGAQAL